MVSALEAQSLNHWTPGEVPGMESNLLTETLQLGLVY